MNKLDLIPEEERSKRVEAFVEACGGEQPVFAIAAINGEGCRPLVYQVQDWLDAHPASAAGASDEAAPEREGSYDSGGSGEAQP